MDSNYKIKDTTMQAQPQTTPDYNFKGRILVQKKEKVYPEVKTLRMKLLEAKPKKPKALSPMNLEELIEMQERRYNPLFFHVQRDLFELMKQGRIQLFFCRRWGQNIQKLIGKNKEKRNYYYVKFQCQKDWFIAEYQGFSTAEWTHNVDFDGIKIKVKEGDFVVKIGEIVKEK